MSCIFRQCGTHPHHIRNSDCLRSYGNLRCHSLYQVRSIITAHKREGNFFHRPVSVCHSVQIGGGSITHDAMGYAYPGDTRLGTYPPPSATDIWWSFTGDLFKLVHLRTHPPPPAILTFSGSHQNTCSWQAGGKYPTAMLFCILSLIN